MATATGNITPETLITLKVSLNDALKKLKLPLKDLNAHTLPAKLRQCLYIPIDEMVVFERYSDSAGGFIALDPLSVPAYKALVRAAKAKGKLRIKATIILSKRKQEQEIGHIANISHPALTSIPQPPPPPAVNLAELAREDSKALATGAINPPQFKDHILNDMLFGMAKSRRAGSNHVSDFIESEFQKVRNSLPASTNQEAPIPKPFVTSVLPEQSAAVPYTVAFRTRDPVTSPPPTAWSVYCNYCDAAMANAHYHCSTCDNGDYDLCESCVGKGLLCPGEDHWLIKRFIQDGKVVSSVTERVGRKPKQESVDNKTEMPMPGTFATAATATAEESKVLAQEPQLPAPVRTCNNCVVVRPEREFVNCNVCKDFDLCILCHMSNDHGHHPAHDFTPVAADASLPLSAQTLLKSGRNVMHNAFCDGCDKKIFGVRHKCLNCPDWDYCSDCVGDANVKHPHHRFAAIYEQLQEPKPNFARHFGVYCDGPLCNGKKHQSYIQGVRYKCAVCHDTDFCASCEAVPHNTHNRTHPLIKFQTPVRNVNVQTINSNNDGRVRTMGDKLAEQPAVKTESIETPVQTMAEIAPSEIKQEESQPPVSHAGQPKDGDVFSPSQATPAAAAPLNATFVSDSVTDGTTVIPGDRFIQIWTLRNEGPGVWPAGCSVRFTGGDNMLNVENGHPASVASIARASESSVISREVQVGEEVSFIITLKAPLREGKSISYWRLKSADGTAFGHRLWCDINVKSSKPDLSTLYPFGRPPPSLERFMIEHPKKLSMAEKMVREMIESGHTPPLLRKGSCTLAMPSTQPTLEDEDFRKELARARVDAIKSKIERYRAEHHKVHAQLNDIALAKAASPTLSTPNNKANAASAQNTSAPESTSSSQMIFPKLEKESPASSILESSKGKAATVETEEGEIENVAAPVDAASAFGQTVVEEGHEIASPAVEDPDDLEILSIDGASEDEDDVDSDDGFLTDEEYDILDASDRETVASP